MVKETTHLVSSVPLKTVLALRLYLASSAVRAANNEHALSAWCSRKQNSGPLPDAAL